MALLILLGITALLVGSMGSMFSEGLAEPWRSSPGPYFVMWLVLAIGAFVAAAGVLKSAEVAVLGGLTSVAIAAYVVDEALLTVASVIAVAVRIVLARKT